MAKREKKGENQRKNKTQVNRTTSAAHFTAKRPQGGSGGEGGGVAEQQRWGCGEEGAARQRAREELLRAVEEGKGVRLCTRTSTCFP